MVVESTVEAKYVSRQGVGMTRPMRVAQSCCIDPLWQRGKCLVWATPAQCTTHSRSPSDSLTIADSPAAKVIWAEEWKMAGDGRVGKGGDENGVCGVCSCEPLGWAAVYPFAKIDQMEADGEGIYMKRWLKEMSARVSFLMPRLF